MLIGQFGADCLQAIALRPEIVGEPEAIGR
jgi:hypothetical protein